MHKNPTGARFVIASKICSRKQISESVSNFFKLVYSQIENVHINAKFLSNYNKFWVLQNSNAFIQSLNNIPNLFQQMTFQHYTQGYLMIN